MRPKPYLMILALVVIIATAVPALASAATRHHCDITRGSESYREKKPVTVTRGGLSYHLQVTIAEAVNTTWEYPNRHHCRYKGRHFWVYWREVQRKEIFTPPNANLKTLIVYTTESVHTVAGPRSVDRKLASGGYKEEVTTPICGKETSIPGQPFVPCAPEAPPPPPTGVSEPPAQYICVVSTKESTGAGGCQPRVGN